MANDRIELPCPSCGATQSIAETQVPPSGEVRCASCGDAISFRATPLGVTDGARRGRVVPHASQSKGAGRPDAVIRIEDWDEPTGETGYLVKCPACGHRFDPETAASDRSTVLIVEDTDFFLHLASEVLGKHYETIGVRTTQEARAVLATTPIDLVVLDLQLPDGEGADVLRAMPRRGIPVLIFTSKDETALLGPTWKGLQALGASDVVHKGINIEDTLLKKAQELLARPKAGATR